ncbi:MAG: cation:proton antiporter [Candidatus Anstonellaceae archaeon]
METARVMLDLGIVLFASFIGASILERMRLPPAIGMVLAGILLNPFTPGFAVESREEITLFAQLGGILMMFVLGLHFEYKHVRKLGVKAFLLAGVASVAAFLGGAVAGWLFGMNLAEVLIVGALVISTSTTMALKIMEETKLNALQNSRLMQAAIVVDDLYGFIALGLISSYIGLTQAAFDEIIFSAIKMLLIMVTVTVTGIRITPYIFEFFERRLPSSSLTLGTAFCLIMTYALLWFGISPFVSAFLAGTILTSSIRYKDVIKSITPVRNLFASVFFVSIGLLINPYHLLSGFAAVIVLSIGAIASKWLASTGMLIKFGCSLKNALKLGASTAPRGEVMLIIAESVVLANVVSPIFLAIATGILLVSALVPATIMRILK